MTIVDDPPIEAAPHSPADDEHRRPMPTTSWRLAARLARREVRRRPGRTVLVALLVAVPVLAMTIGSILVRSNTDAAQFSRNYGTADLAVSQFFYVDEFGNRREPVDLAERAGDALPDGATSSEIFTVYTTVTPRGGDPTSVVVTRFDPQSPITSGIVEVSQGRLPAAADEVLLQPSLADDLGVGVGDSLPLDRPDRTVTVVGLGRAAADYDRALMLFGRLDPSDLRNGTLTTVVDLPDGIDGRTFVDGLLAQDGLRPDDLNDASIELRDGGSAGSGYYGEPVDPDTQTLAWGWVAGVLLLTALGVIIAAAFATSARRQLATVGQLAANGASPRLIRRTLSLQGTWSGAVGAIGGVVAGVALFLVGTPLLEWIVGRTWNNTVIRPGDLIILLLTGTAAATIAALTPARSLAQTTVLQALAGRRPIRPVKARTVTIGLVCFAAGLFLLVVAAVGGREPDGQNGNLFALVAVLGGLAVLAGMCLASPMAVTASTAVASRLSASWKLSGRSLSRTRWRSAAVVTAIGVAGAFAIAAGTVAAGLDMNPDEGPTDMPRNEVLLRANDGSVSTIDPSVLAAVRDIVGSSAESTVLGLDLAQPTAAEWNAATSDGQIGLSGIPTLTSYDIAVADDRLLDAMGMSSADRATLADVGAMTTFGYYVADETPSNEGPRVEVTLIGGGQQRRFDVAPIQDFTTRDGVDVVVMTEAKAAELGLDTIPVGIRFNGADDLAIAQQGALDTLRFGNDSPVDSWIVGGEPVRYPDTASDGFWIAYQYVNHTPSKALIQAAIAGAALLLVLVVVAIGLSLAAAESRDERNTLIAVGASPTTLRRRSATTAVLLSATGGVIAVPAGFLPVWMVLRSNHEATAVPWVSIVAVVLVIPVVVGAAALLGSAIIQGIRPPRIMQDRID